MVVAAAYLVTACAWDVKERRIPDWLNYGAWATALLIAVWQGRIAEAAGASALAFAFAYFLYRIGAWAGGDAKLFAAATAFLALVAPQAGLFAFAVFFANSVFAAVPLALAVNAKGLWGLRAELTRLWKPALKNALKTGLAGAAAGTLFATATSGLSELVNPLAAYAAVFIALLLLPIPLWLSAIVFAAAVFFDAEKAALFFAAAAAIGFAGFYCINAFGLVRSRLLRKRVSVNELQEGMIPANTMVMREGKAVEVRGLSLQMLLAAAKKMDATLLQSMLKPKQDRILADSSRARGLTQAEIKELKQANVRELEVRESLAFAPALAAGWAVSVLWGLGWLIR
ncbi:hypothetical protein AUJ65_05690 [Candidatus Micrarchaeota archaeon CG1_02_51_15]|nr:MAG: hypothetical protein AUJ65_05690 [Candidatus Micrarchaeota archaeon CG1_02_51_15]